MRLFLLITVCVASIGALAQDEIGTQLLLAPPVLENVATTGQGGDVIADYLGQSEAAGVEWQTATPAPLHELLFREVSLNETNVDVATLLNTHLFPRVTSLFVSLESLQTANPIEDLEDFFPGMLDAVTYDGELYGVPIRHATSGLHYNQALLDEVGLSGPPETAEEFVEYARKLTFTREDGSRVYGFVIPGDGYANIVDVARMWDGDFITPEYEVVANQPAMVTAVTLLRDFFEEGVLPTSWPSLSSPEVDTWIQTGRAAMTFSTTGRNRSYNNPEQSQYPGQIFTANIPITEELSDVMEVAPAKTEFWSLVIPANSQDPEASWDLLRYLTSKEAVLAMALNGNGPTRASAYADPSFAETLPYAAVEMRALAVARIALPSFDRAPQAADAILQSVQRAVLGAAEPQQAMDDLARELESFLD